MRSVPGKAFGQRQFRSVQLSDDEIEEILRLCRESLSLGSLSAGRLVNEFEGCFAAQSRLPHAVAMSSGTVALEAILRAVGVAGRKVLVPTNTFAASAFAAVHAGGQPVLIDMDPRTLAPSPSQLESALDRHGEAVAAFILVHVGGFIGDATKELADVCRSRAVALVEDAAHAHGSLYRGDTAGFWGVGAAYSFFATKVMTSAEGGMVVTSRDDVASFARSYRDQGRDPDNPKLNLAVGTNSRLSELHAALGLAELRRLPSVLANRRRVAEWYGESLGELAGVAAVAPVEGCEPNYYKYLLRLANPEMGSRFSRFARSHGLALPSGVYEVPLHRQPVFERAADNERFPGAEDFCSRHMALPVGRAMDRHDVDDVVALLRECVLQMEVEPGAPRDREP